MQASIKPKILFIIIIVLSVRFFTSAHVAFASSALANIWTDTTLDASTVYTVDGTSVVEPSVTLTIPAGTQLIFTPGSSLVVRGALIANGTSDSHISVVGGPIPPFIPFISVAFAQSTAQNAAQTPAVTPPGFPQSPDVAPIVSNGVMMGADTPTPGKHSGIVFSDGSTSSLQYVDIRNGIYGAIVSQGSTVTMDHVAFSDCDTGILGIRGSLQLANSAFNNIPIPVSWDFHGGFIHTNTVFSNDGFNGWVYGGELQAGDTMRLDSTDGEYEIPYVTVGQNASLVINPGVTIKMIDRQPLTIDGGTLSAIGTADQPIVFYGDGTCLYHSSIIYQFRGTAAYQYVHFQNLCSGLLGNHTAAISFSNDSFDTIAGPAIQVDDYSTVTIDTVVFHDTYQVLKLTNVSKGTISHSAITLVNGGDPAIYALTQSPLVITDSSMDNAATCLNVSQNSSLTADHLTLTHCGSAGINSSNTDGGTNPTGITLTNSEISHSGTALQLGSALVLDVSHNIFHDNVRGVSLANMPATTLINNGWGNDSGPTIADNPTGTGDVIYSDNVPSVTYRPWIGMTPPPEHNPIIIVPGITGSFLTKDYGDGDELWPNIAKMVLSPTDSFLNDLKLLQAGVPSGVRPVKVGDIIRSVGSTDVFAGMIQNLQNSGYTEGSNLFVLPYDWRLSNTQNQALLDDAIANALAKSGKSKVNIIAHSMGGLLVKDYIAQHPAVPLDHLFYIAVPHLGSPKAFKALMYGDTMGFDFSLGPVHIPFLNADRVKTIVQNMPSVYELLPSQHYMDTIGHHVTDVTQTPAALGFDAVNTLMINNGRNEKMFPFAQALHDATDTLTTPTAASYDFAGCGATKTVGGFKLTTNLKHRLLYTAGDGVVPVQSATAASDATQYYVTSASHGTMPSIVEIQKAIIDILNAKNVTTGATLSTDSHHCALSGDIVEVHSPVTLDIYDDAHRHTGPTASGEIEQNIPNVDYEMIGDEKFAFLPSGPTYTIVDRGQAVGSYDMYISHGDDTDAITQETYFGNVAITEKSIGTVTVGPATTDYAISMDDNGDGIVDRTIAPSAPGSDTVTPTPDPVPTPVPPVTTPPSPDPAPIVIPTPVPAPVTPSPQSSTPQVTPPVIVNNISNPVMYSDTTTADMADDTASTTSETANDPTPDSSADPAADPADDTSFVDNSADSTTDASAVSDTPDITTTDSPDTSTVPQDKVLASVADRSAQPEGSPLSELLALPLAANVGSALVAGQKILPLIGMILIFLGIVAVFIKRRG